MNFTYFLILFQSNLIECFVFAFIYAPKFVKLTKTSKWQTSFAVTSLCNCITHPVVFFGFMASGLSYFWAVLAAEAFAIVTEALLHRAALASQMSLARTAVASLLANLASWQIGPILTYWILRFIQ